MDGYISGSRVAAVTEDSKYFYLRVEKPNAEEKNMDPFYKVSKSTGELSSLDIFSGAYALGIMKKLT